MGKRSEHIRIIIKNKPAFNRVGITDADDLFKLENVLRVKTGDSIFIVFPFASEEKWKILEIYHDYILIEFEKQIKKYEQPSFALNLFISAVSMKKLGDIIHCAIELNINSIYIFQAQNSTANIKRLNREKISRKVEESVLQCKRLDLPEVRMLESFTDALALSAEHINTDSLLFHQDAEQNLNFKMLKNKNADIFIGPEGGFDPNEIERHNLYNNFYSAKLFSNTLRVNTAVISALSSILTLKEKDLTK